MLGGRGQLTWKNPVAENGSSLIVKLNIVGYSSGVRTPGWHPWLGDPRVGLTLTTVGGFKIASDFLKPVSRRIGFLLRPQAWVKVDHTWFVRRSVTTDDDNHLQLWSQAGEDSIYRLQFAGP